ncbi:MAG TPA: hypothetical protein ENG33_06940, partial [Chloroflexi bacterium]|nr:hypothetical protein [Chloroflexota bacterium]
MEEKVYAEVIVNLSLKRRKGEPPPSFHYFIPPKMRPRVQLGQIVMVPFGPRLLQGVVVNFSTTSPVEETKPLAAVLDISILPHQISLARWISDYYLAPLNEALTLMLPPGIGGRAQSIIELNPQAQIPSSLDETERAIISLLQRYGNLRLTQLERFLPGREWQKALRKLLRKGLVFRRPFLSPPRVAPRQARYAVLTAGEEKWREGLKPLARPSVEANVLKFLANSKAPLLSLSEVCKATKCTRATLKRMEKKGLVRLLPPRKLLLPALPRGELQQMLENIRKRAPVQAIALEFLLQHPPPLPKEELASVVKNPSSVIRTLQSKGLVNVVEEEASVLLEISPQDALQMADELQGLKVYQRILQLLHAEGKPISVGDLYAETGCNFRDLRKLEEAGLIELISEEKARDPLAGLVFTESPPPELTPDQAMVWEEIK